MKENKRQKGGGQINYLANSAEPTTGTLMVVTVSVRGPTDMEGSKNQCFTRRYDTVPLLCHVMFTWGMDWN